LFDLDKCAIDKLNMYAFCIYSLYYIDYHVHFYKLETAFPVIKPKMDQPKIIDKCGSPLK